uniref:DUF834 domain-containing protein n=1 Tax=Oryza meridionalis TaxID=40149 RepID=A0A0E0EPD2_9ORYZ
MANAPTWSVVSPRPRGIFPSARTGPHPAEVYVVLSKWGEERARSRVGRGLASCRRLGTLRPTSSRVKGEDGKEVGEGEEEGVAATAARFGTGERGPGRGEAAPPRRGEAVPWGRGSAGRESTLGKGPPEREEALGEIGEICIDDDDDYLGINLFTVIWRDLAAEGVGIDLAAGIGGGEEQLGAEGIGSDLATEGLLAGGSVEGAQRQGA